MDDDPLGFGADVSSIPDLDGAFAPIAGFRALGEALARRLETPAGRLAYDPDYGTDLRDYLHEDWGPGDPLYSQLASLVEREAEKDERVLSASAELALDTTTQRLVVSLGILTAAGPYALTLAIDAVSATVLAGGVA